MSTSLGGRSVCANGVFVVSLNCLPQFLHMYRCTYGLYGDLPFLFTCFELQWGHLIPWGHLCLRSISITCSSVIVSLSLTLFI